MSNIAYTSYSRILTLMHVTFFDGDDEEDRTTEAGDYDLGEEGVRFGEGEAETNVL